MIRRLLKYKKEHSEVFREVKSFKLFHQMFGGLAGAYIEMWEFDDLTELEKCWKKESKDEGFMKIHQDFTLLIDPTTFSMKAWNSVV